MGIGMYQTILLVAIMIELLISKVHSLSACEEKLDSILFEDIPFCETNDELEKITRKNGLDYNDQQEKQYPCKFNNFHSSESILRSSVGIAVSKTGSFTREIKGNDYLLTKIIVNLQVLREEFQNNNMIFYLDITLDQETRTFPFKMIGQSSEDWNELAFHAVITSKFSNLVINFYNRRLNQLQNQNLNPLLHQTIQGSHLIFSQFVVWGQYLIDSFQQLECQNSFNNNLLKLPFSRSSISEQSTQSTGRTAKFSCVDGLVFDEFLQQCVRDENNLCPDDTKETLKTKDCVDECLQGEMEFYLQDDNRYAYCSEGQDFCNESCSTCDLSGNICFLCKEGFTKSANNQFFCVNATGKSIQIVENQIHDRTQPSTKSLQYPGVPEQLPAFSAYSSLNPPRRLYSANVYRCQIEFNLGQDCYQCIKPFVMIHGDCFLCPRSTYPIFDLYSSSCKVIPDPGCSDYDSFNICYACFLGYRLVAGACNRVTSCSVFEFLGSNNQCHQCSTSIPNCTHCYTNNICKDCAYGYYLYSPNGFTDNPTLICVATCPDGYFANSDNLCEPCGSKCKTCTSPGTICTTCMTNYQFVSGYYNNEPTTKKRCMATNGDCTRGCTSCSLYMGQTVCNNTGCMSVYYFNYGFCYYCGDNCQSCTNQTTCSVCKAGITLVGGKCPRICGPGKFLDNNSNCSGCNNNKCAQCTNSHLCSTCLAGYISLGGVCADCPSGCSQCSNEMTCQICQSGFTLNPITFQCYNCLPNQYLSSTTCVNCPSECTSCSSATVCTACSLGFSLNSNACEIICIGHFYRNPATNKCKPCPSGCSACTSSSVCTSCKTGFLLNSSFCEKTCNSSTYRDTSTNSCVPCPVGCSACSSDTVCSACSPGYTFNSPNCIIICNTSFYRDSSTNTCNPCMSNCSLCPNSSICTTCSLGYVALLNNTCSQNSICGDGKPYLPAIIGGISYPKECDDSNIINGDGCSFNCKIESGYSCQYSQRYLKSVCIKKIIYNEFTLDPQSNLKNKDPIIKVKFSIPLVQYSAINLLSALEQDMTVSISTVSNNDYSYTVSLNSGNDELILTFNMQVAAKNRVFTITFNSKIFIQQNYLTQNSKTSDFPDYVIIPQGAVAAANAIASIGSATSSSILASILPIILFANFQLLFNALDLFQMIFYLQYIELRIPYNVITFIEIMSSFKLPISTNYIEEILKIYPLRKSYAPNSFSDSDVEGLFLGNTGDSISQISILLVIHGLLKLSAQFLASRQSKCPQKIGNYLKKKLYQSWEYGWYLDMYWDMYLSLVVGAILQFYQIEIYNFFSAVNILLTFLIFILVIASPIVFWWIIRKKKSHLEDENIRFKWGMLYESLKIEEPVKILPITHPSKLLQSCNIEKKSTNVGSLELEGEINNNLQPVKNLNQNNNSPGLWNSQNIKQSISFTFDKNPLDVPEQDSPLKTNVKNNNFRLLSSLTYIPLPLRLTKYFYVALYARKLLFGIIIASLNPYPYFQISFLCSLNVILISYVVLTKPYHSRFENIKSIICEVFMIIAQISFAFLIPDPEDQEESSRMNLGWIFIGSCSGILVLQFVFIFTTFIPQMRMRLKQICCRNKDKMTVRPEEQIPKQLEKNGDKQTQELQLPVKEQPKIVIQSEQNNLQGAKDVVKGQDMDFQISRQQIPLILHSPEKRFRKINNASVRQFDQLLGNQQQAQSMLISVNSNSKNPKYENEVDFPANQLISNFLAPTYSQLPSINQFNPGDSPPLSYKNTPNDSLVIGSFSRQESPYSMSSSLNMKSSKRHIFLEEMKKSQTKRIFLKTFLDLPKLEDEQISSNSKDLKYSEEFRDQSQLKDL